MGNPFVHVELHTDDLKAAKKFYKGLFDWALEDMDMGGSTYTMVAVGKGTGGGMMAKMSPQEPSGWLTYVEVTDLKKTIAKAKKLGAQVLVESQEVPGMGSFGLFVDPSGAQLGVWESAKPAKPAKKKAKKKNKK
jgi:predicted enzyme related to lactoylglutathione lyase